MPLDVLYITIMHRDVNSNNATGSTCLALGMKARCRLVYLGEVATCLFVCGLIYGALNISDYLASSDAMMAIGNCLKGGGPHLILVFYGGTEEDYGNAQSG
jgi:hypothetical protein